MEQFVIHLEIDVPQEVAVVLDDRIVVLRRLREELAEIDV